MTPEKSRASTREKARHIASGRVDFKAIKRAVTIEHVLGHYGLLACMQRTGDELSGLCPLHQETVPSFQANVARNVFHCFGCGKGGSVIDFVASMEAVSFRDAARTIHAWFCLAPGQPAHTPPGDVEMVHLSATRLTHEKGNALAPEQENKQPVNLPLRFTLQKLDVRHPYLIGARGLAEETIDHFGVGYYAGRGILHGRICIPIHNAQGDLLAYAGRWPGDPPAGTPKYKLPPNFRKSLVVYNLHRVKDTATVQGVVLCEGFFDVMAHYQKGQHNAVAIMGSSLSVAQESLIVNTVGSDGRVLLAFDNDRAGQQCTEEVLRRLSRRVYVKVMHP